MNIAEISIRNSTITWVCTFLLLFGGLFSYQSLSRLEDPEFTIKEALVITQYPGATPIEVEQEVTDMLETAIQKMSQVKEIRSYNMEGASIITVEMQEKYDKHTLPGIWEQLRRKVRDAQTSLPPGAGPSVVNDDFGDVYGILFAITGDGYSYQEIKDHADFVKRELLLVDDVAKIAFWGDQQEAIYVEFSRSKMAQLGISQEQVYGLLSQQNLISPAGKVKVGRDYVRIQPQGGINAVADIANLLIPNRSNNLIRLQDIAEVKREYVTPATKLMRFNGRTGITMGISTISGGNVVTMGEAVMERLQELQALTPVGLETNITVMQSDSVVRAIDNFVVSLLQAIAIVIVVLLLFMGVRSGLLIGVILLITVIGTFILMKNEGVALERISLGALVIALGMLVDNAIVVTEGILIRIQAGEDRLQAAKKVVAQTMWPLLGATVIAIMAFGAIGFSQDSTGEFCRSLFQVLLYSLGLSWVIAVTITPLLCVTFLKVKESNGDAPDDPYDGAFFRGYRSFLIYCLKLRWLTLILMVVMLAVSVWGFTKIEQSFFPKSTTPQFMMHYWLPQGSDIRKTDEDVRLLEAKLLADKRIDAVSTFVGGGAPRFLLTYAAEKVNSSYAFLLVNVHDYQDIDTLMVEYADYLAETFPDAEPKMEKFKLGPGGGSAIEARFSGPNPDVLRELGEQAKAIMYRDGGLISIRDDWRQRVKLVRPHIAETQAQLAGITRADLNDALNTNFSGSRVGIYREDDELLPIISRAPASERMDISEISNIQIWSEVAGKALPIDQVVANYSTQWEDSLVHRLDRKRTITVGAEPKVGNASVILKRIKSDIEAIEIPLGYEMTWGGEFENSSDAQAGLTGFMPVTVGIMVLVCIILFNSLKIPLIIWLTVPLALIGVSAGLLLVQEPFGFMPLLGALSLVGMLIKNAIVLLDQINLELAEGKEPIVAILDSAVSRSRPVAMAAGTTVLGMIPLLADDFFKGMAVTIMGGLTFASILTLIVVPVLYAVFFNVQVAKAES
ncbi:MAG: efflux RND transporter permease subunit [Motiliproteus sp.]